MQQLLQLEHSFRYLSDVNSIFFWASLRLSLGL
jgi:hypothetical protein